MEWKRRRKCDFFSFVTLTQMVGHVQAPSPPLRVYPPLLYKPNEKKGLRTCQELIVGVLRYINNVLKKLYKHISSSKKA